jgi:hypothetical protein
MVILVGKIKSVAKCHAGAPLSDYMMQGNQSVAAARLRHSRFIAGSTPETMEGPTLPRAWNVFNRARMRPALVEVYTLCQQN